MVGLNATGEALAVCTPDRFEAVLDFLLAVADSRWAFRCPDPRAGDELALAVAACSTEASWTAVCDSAAEGPVPVCVWVTASAVSFVFVAIAGCVVIVPGEMLSSEVSAVAVAS